ncbi:hypothetical protein C8N24_2819 [Solirubrobacter pauli]|uniref:Fibronectin type-III domain-containing protein n=1 Tax=Solirubrobacter pauli TaxID=166793 RepID=A0A660LD79_9ACTN|nr:hypothetical protein [Solirubrobacter pauli]RKQ92962.1 hypothetical protein C8N24_2819 [Solirubrobacter pauli]
MPLPSFRRLLLAILALGCTSAVVPHAANAGTYTVSGVCGVWEPYVTPSSGITVYPECPWVRARNIGADGSTPAGQGGGWVFRAPAGTWIDSFTLQGAMLGTRGWQVAGYYEGGSVPGRDFEGCPGASCPGQYRYFNGNYPGYGASGLVMRLRCGAGGCPNDEGVTGYFYINQSSIRIADPSPPSVGLVGGSLLSGGWKSGVQTLVVDAQDNTGISEYRASLDGATSRRLPMSCNYGVKVPCPAGPQTLEISTAGLADGAHTVTGEASDASGNPAAASATIYADNTPPTQPLDVKLESGAGWHSDATVKLSWANPAQNAAPIVAAVFRMCPTLPASPTPTQRTAAEKRCVQGTRSGANLKKIDDLKLPEPGAWDLKLWLMDAAGNNQPASAVSVNSLAYDDTAPSDVAFLGPDPADPARVHVSAADSVSGVAMGAIEVRRDGTDAWQALPTEATASGLTAVLDDENLPKGLYFLRARAVNAAGLETSTDRDGAGNTAMTRLPIRLASRLTAGRRGKRVCRGHGRKRHCRYRLATKPKVGIGKPTRLYGRLTVAGKSMAGAQVQVWRRLELDGAQWAQIGTVTTSRTGRFSYRAQRGPARAIRFRYPGTPTIRGRNGDVALRVKASTSLRPNRRNVINGEYVVFRGRLRGGWIPAAGALVELQVYSRGSWRTFAQPRANAKTGRWAYRYRFETVRGRANFRFRARIRRQPAYPFTTGTSRPVRVRVRGL